MRTILILLVLLSGCGILSNGNDPNLACKDQPEEICARLGKDCGVLQTTDDCGEDRVVACGQCEAPETCGGEGVPNECGCVAESDRSVCERLLKNCDSFTSEDNCGQPRNVSCGRCGDGEICGDSIPNVCGCPCRIDGTCYAESQPNPQNPCEICDPSQSTDAWSNISVGEVCDDNDPCTENEMCDASGQCVGSDVQCPSTGCAIGACSPIDGSCVLNALADGTSCDDDGVSCTVGSCAAGACVESRVDDFCVIDDACFRDQDPNPANECQYCDSANAPDAWTAKPDATVCDGSVTACDTGACNAGVCETVLLPNRCLIDNTCYVAGDRNPLNECEICDPNTATDAWTPYDGAACTDNDGIICTQGVCSGNVCEPEIVETFCLINNICYMSRDPENATSCNICSPGVSQTSFTPRPQNSYCNLNLFCRCGAGDVCRGNNGTGGACLVLP